MNAEEMWNLYKRSHPSAEKYEAWAFAGGGDLGDELADLVVEGLKTATASAYCIYEVEKAPIPSVGALSVILRSDGEAVCIIKTTGIEVRRFRDVTEEHAFLEGEDDRSLEEWRRGHQKFFTREMEPHGLHFDEDMLVVCERFVVEYI
jgi:uncharacterized protein YhfF